MKCRPDDTTEMLIVVHPDFGGPATQTLAPPAVDNAVARRAFRHGQRAQPHFPAWLFEEVEAELRAGWLLNGETARWRDVRETVREGFEHRPADDR